jgi:hypothetical protein
MALMHQSYTSKFWYFCELLDIHNPEFIILQATSCKLGLEARQLILDVKVAGLNPVNSANLFIQVPCSYTLGLVVRHSNPGVKVVGLNPVNYVFSSCNVST